MEFSREERTAIIVLGLVAGFVIGVDHVVSVSKSVISIDYTTGLGFLILAAAGMVLSVFLHELAHKWVARSIGYFTHVTLYPAGLAFGVALSLFTFGWVQFFTPNTCDLEADPRARIYKHRKYENWKQEAFIAVSGIFVTAFIAILMHGLWTVTGFAIFRKLLLGNLWLMLFSLIPFELLSLYSLKLLQTIDQLPQSDGLYLLHYSIYAYVFTATFALVLAALLFFFDSQILSIALLVACLTTFVVWLNFFRAEK